MNRDAEKLSVGDLLLELERRLTHDRAKEVRAAVLSILKFVPEEVNAADGVLTEMCDGESVLGPLPPLLSESFLYPLIGKDDARTLLGRVGALCEVLGFDRRSLELEWAGESASGSELDRVREDERRSTYHQLQGVYGSEGLGWLDHRMRELNIGFGRDASKDKHEFRCLLCGQSFGQTLPPKRCGHKEKQR